MFNNEYFEWASFMCTTWNGCVTINGTLMNIYLESMTIIGDADARIVGAILDRVWDILLSNLRTDHLLGTIMSVPAGAPKVNWSKARDQTKIWGFNFCFTSLTVPFFPSFSTSIDPYSCAVHSLLGALAPTCLYNWNIVESTLSNNSLTHSIMSVVFLNFVFFNCSFCVDSSCGSRTRPSVP